MSGYSLENVNLICTEWLRGKDAATVPGFTGISMGSMLRWTTMPRTCGRNARVANRQYFRD